MNQRLRPIAAVGAIAAALTPLVMFLPAPYQALGHALLAAGTAIVPYLMQPPSKKPLDASQEVTRKRRQMATIPPKGADQ